MRIAFLCKRRYMGKDVIDDGYARLYEIPFQLARLGHNVRGYCLGYQGQPAGEWEHEASPGSLIWTARSVQGLKAPDVLAYPFQLLRQLRKFKPDVLIGASDIPHVALAAWLSKRLGVPFATDLYDNFEGFGQAKVPGMKALLRWSVRNAGLVTATSEPLARLVREGYGARGKVVAMPSTVDKAVFRPMDKRECRLALGLPLDARLIGTAGGLMRDRGVGVLYEAWQSLHLEHADLHLVLAGPVDPDFPPPQGPRVHCLGMVPHAASAQLFGALDVGVIYLRDTPFGRYCFPQKAYEMIACELAIAATNVGAMGGLLAGVPGSLYEADDVAGLTRCIQLQLRDRKLSRVMVRSWSDAVAELDQHLRLLS